MNPLFVDVSAPSTSSASNSSPSAPRAETRMTRGYPVVPSTDILFPDFAHLKRLGRGSYGTVVKAYYKGRTVAAKLVETDIDHVHIHNEADLLDKLKHENIVKLLALFHGEQTGLVLELMEGGSLHELLHQHHHVQYFGCHVLGWAQQVATALSYLHGKGYLHRDLKPSNMLLTNDFITLKLCDFGTVAELRTSMTNNRGTPAWMAPEVFRGKKYDQKCDIFSFGVLLWEIVTRRQPFSEWDSHMYTILWQVSEGRRPPRISNCPAPIMELIERCWKDNAKERPDVEEVVGIIDILCEIYPNRYLPLVDKTTKQQAFAHPTEQPSSPYYSSGHYYSPSTQRAHHNSNAPPVPPPPRIQLPSSHSYQDFSHRQPQDRTPPPPLPSSGSYSNIDVTNRFSGMNLNSHYDPSTTNFHPPSPAAPYGPHQYSSPMQNAPPYQPYGVGPLGVPPSGPPHVPPCGTSVYSPLVHDPNACSSPSSASAEIGWRRSSEPVPSDTDSAYGSHEEKKKKSHGIKRILNGIRKEFQDKK